MLSGELAVPVPRSWTSHSKRTISLDWTRDEFQARVTSDTGKLDRGLTQLLHEKLHWLDVRDRVTFTLVVVVHRCQNGRAPQYLAVHCVPLSSQRHLRSAERNLLHVPRHRHVLLVRPPGTVFRTLSATLTPPKLLLGACMLKTFWFAPH